MKDQIKKLRAIADFAEKHGLEQHLAGANVGYGTDVSLYERRTESALAALLQWAEALGSSALQARDADPLFHVYAYGTLPDIDGTVSVVVVLREAESDALVEAGVPRLADHAEAPVTLDVARKCIRGAGLTPELLAEAKYWADNPLPRDPGATS